MSNEPIEHWIAKARQVKTEVKAEGSLLVQSRKPKTNGQVIMEIAETIRPIIAAFFKNARDGNGMLVQPARIRGIALNVAQDLVKAQQ